MTATQDDTIAELQRTVGDLRRERDAALAQRTSEFSERIEHQAATVGVLKAMSASPGDPQPVFNLITRRAAELCESSTALYELREGQLNYMAGHGMDLETIAAFRQSFPRPLDRSLVAGRAIMERRIIHVQDVAADTALSQEVRDLGGTAIVGIPLLRDGEPIGAVALNGRQPAGFSESQIALLQTFAEQAVIAITSAETYRALQTRTSDLQESLEYQTAISDVLKVIGGSGFALEPVFQVVVNTAVRLCRADQAVIYRLRDDAFRWAAGTDMLPEYERIERAVAIHPGTGTLIGRVAMQGRPVQILDAWTDPLYEVKDDARAGGVHTMLGVPLLLDGVTIGAIGLARLRIEPYTDRQIELVTTFADQAVIAIENARLIAEQTEALEQRTATAEVLQVINASPGDLTPVFDAVLDKALRLCDANFGQLTTFDGVGFRAAAWQGFPPEPNRPVATPPPTPGMALYRLVHGEKVVHVPDITADEVYRSGNSGRRRLADEFGARTAIWVALKKDTTLLGAFVIYRTEVRPFSGKQIALLQSFAAQAVIAMENARLITEQREALEQQTATAEVLQVINASPGNLAPVFDAMLQKATDLCAAAFGILWTFDGEHYHAVAFRNVPSAYSEFLHDPPPATPLTPLGRIAAGEAFAHITDMADESFAAGGPMFHRAVELGGFRTIVGVQLRKDAVLLGAITIYRQEVRPFSDEQIVLLQNFAAQAVVAMENARLLDEIRQRQEELRITFENMGDGVAMFDETQHLVAWNRKFQDILDVPDDIIARRQTYSEYVRYLAERGEFGPDPEEQVHQFVEQAGRSRTYERTRPDGRVIEVRHNPVPSGGFVLIFSDITERKRNEAEIRAARDAAETALRDLRAAQANLIQAEKMASLGQLTAGIAHEIKNPLNFVNNFSALSTELIDELRDVLAPEPLGETARTEVDDLTALLKGNLEKVVQHGQRADGIVRSMLDHSRGSSGERLMVDLNTLIDEALNLAYHGARAQDQSFNIMLERSFGEGIAPIDVNPQDITRVFLNLFSNGFYAATRRARDGGDAEFVPMLKVTSRDAGEAVEIRVRDNGTGIPADIRDKLFQPFFTTKPTGEGTGLGLSITYDIVTQQHGGTITVDSKFGDYSEFTVQLPRGILASEGRRA